MKIMDGAITCHAESGRITIQVPEIVLGSSGYVDLLDNWFVKLRSEEGLPSRQGYTFLSPAGWAANKEVIRAAFETSGSQKTWEEFEARVAEIFTNRELAKEREVTRLQQKIERLIT